MTSSIRPTLRTLKSLKASAVSYERARCHLTGRPNVTAYDAMYVALAEALDAPLVTCDTPLAKAPGHRAHIEVIQ